MHRPPELASDAPLVWSPGRGSDVWALFNACIDGNLAVVEGLLLGDPALVRCQYHYRKPIYFAVRENRLDVAALLLERDPDPVGLAINDSLFDIACDRGYGAMQELLETKLRDVHGGSAAGEPVAAALRAYDLAAMARLLDAAPQLLHTGDLRGNRPLHWAAMTRQLPAIDEILSRGADLEVQRIDGARPLQLANGDYHHRGWRDVPKDRATTPAEVIAHLRSRGAECDICTAAHIGDLARVGELLDRDPALANRPSDYVSYYPCSGTAIRNAAGAGHIEIVKLLVARGADPNLPEEGIAPRGHALYAAATNGHRDIVRLLLAHGAYPNVETESSADTLSRVLAKGDRELVDLLCAHGAARGVHLLAYDNDLQTAAAVFAANPDRAADSDALANAAGQGHEAFVRLMLTYQPDLPRQIAFPGWSVGGKTPEINELLFQHGMNPSAPDWLGVTPLHHFARTGDVAKAEQFLDHGADVHARDEDICSTPLAWAAKFGQLAMAELLLRRGAQVQLPDDPPWATPLAWATRREHAAVADLLRAHGAR